MLTPGIISDSLNSDFLLQQEPDIHQVLDAGINNEGNVKPLPSLSLTKPDNDPVQNFFKTVGEKQTEEAKFAPSFLDYDASNIDRYKQADQWKQLGYNPEQGYQNEYKYGERQSWGDVMGNALGGAWELGANTFMEGWKGWGNMANALFNWGSDKTFTERLMGDDAELAVISKEQEDIMNKYAIFATPESENSIFNRQFFGSLVQQSGFALGTMAQFAAESVLTAGLSDALGLSEAKLAFNATKGMTIAQKAEKLKEIKQIGDVWWKSESVASKIFNAAAKATGIQDAVNLSKAGVGAKYLAMSGLGGTKRILSELNMARTEAMMEAAGTYGDLKKSMTADFLLKNDRTPSAAELNQIDQAAHNAALDNFKVNTGVLLLMNRIQFGNMFSKFGSKRSLLKGIESSYGDDIFSVTGMVDGKLKTTPFKKGMFGPMSSYAEIAGEFGKKKALWETTKYAGKGLLKWEGSEGVQELIQEGSNTTIKDYYTSLYDGDPRSEASWGSSIEQGVSSQANMQGLKTFLMGAVTGRLISPISYGMQKGMDLYKKATDKDYKSAFERREADINQSVSLLKEFYSNPAKYMPEWIANTKVQNKAAQDITTALKANSRYIYNNKRDSAFAKMISAAIKTDMIDSVLDTVKGYGDNLTPQQFNEAFGLEATDNNKQVVNDYFNKISNEVVDFHNTWKELKDKYGDRVMPQLYKEGEDRNRAYMAKRALDESIEILAINNYKARKAVIRSAEVLNEAAKNKGLGSSVYAGFNILGSDVNMDREIALLTNEITQLEAAPSDPKTKELINDKKEELRHLVGWKATYNNFTESDETNDELAKLMLESFKGYMNVKNKQADSKSVVTDDDVNETFFRLTDYIKLNKDSKDFIDAFNIVADPKNWSNVHSNIMEGMLQARAELMKKHIKETAEGINQKNKDAESPDQNELSNDELGDALMDALEQEQPETKNTQPADLEDFMMAEYTTAKKAADAQGIKIPDYEVWKKGAGKFVEERFNKMKNGTTAQTTEEKPTISNAKKGRKGLNGIDEIIFSDPNFKLEGFEIDGNYWNVITSTDRAKVLVNINGVIVPFYLTTGQAGKGLIPGWYPFFGIGKDGWLNKTDKSDMETYYERYWGKDAANIVKSIAEELNNFYGTDPANFKNDGDPNATSKPLSILGEKVEDYINSKLSYTPAINNEDARKILRSNVEQLGKEINAKYNAELAALEGKPAETAPIQELTSVKIGKYTLEVGDLVNGKEILAITPTHIIQDGIRNPITYSEMKSKLDAFAGNNITKKADITSTSKEKPLENGQIDNPGEINNALGKTATDSNKNVQNANPMLFGKGSPKVIPAGSKVNNRSDNYEEVTEGNKTFRRRTDTNEKYPVFVATTAFGIGDNLTLEVDYNIDNFEGRDGIVTKADFFVGDKIKDSVKEEFPIAIYTIHNGEKVKIGYVPTVSWLQERWADDSTKNVVEILTDDEGNEINNLEIQTEKLIKLREKIFENHNKNPNFVQNAIVNNKSEGVLRVMETGKEKLSVNLNPNDIQLGVIRKNEIFVNGTTSLLNEVGANNIIVNFDDIENKNGWPVVILSTPTGKKLISYVSIPTLEEKDQDLIIESWKAFKNMQDPAYKPSDFELDLVKNIHKQVNKEYVQGETISFDILQNYFNNYITFQSGRKLDPTMKEGTSQMNITKDGSLFVWVRDNNDPQQVLEIKNVSDLEAKDAVLRDKLSKLYYNVRLSENNFMGIGNEKIYSMIILERNADNSFKIKLKDMTYKQHLMDTLETNIDKGVPVDENNPQSPWVYFANPVVTYDLTNTTLAEDTLKAAKDIVISDDSAAKEFGLDLSMNKSDYKAHIINSDDELSDMLNECKIAQ
jgi:hypothetical protein